MKKVTVILTTYNSEKYVKRALDSILNQTGINLDFSLELIVIDDCSTDNTLDILKSYDLSPISTKINSGGPNKGRNIGLMKCTGDVICIMDHDDEWLPHRLISQLQLLGKAPIVSSGYITRNSQTGRETRCQLDSSEKYRFFDKNETFLVRLTKDKKGQHTYFGSLLFTIELKHILFEEEVGKVDYDYVLRLFHQRTSIEVGEPLYIRHVDGSNLSLNEQYRLDDFNLSLQHVDQYQDDFPKQVNLAKQRIHGTMGRYYYQTNKMSKARTYFIKSEWHWKTILYYLTTFAGSGIVKKYFKVFG